jgi:hypothetical protein
MARTATASIYDTITNQIIAALERGTGDYTLPWHRSSAPLTRPINAVTRKAYRGVNVLALWASAEAQDFGHGLWATYRQWQSLGAQVRKGEKASPIVFYKVLDKAEGSEDEAREGDAAALKALAGVPQLLNGLTRPGSVHYPASFQMLSLRSRTTCSSSPLNTRSMRGQPPSEAKGSTSNAARSTTISSSSWRPIRSIHLRCTSVQSRFRKIASTARRTRSA